MTDYQWDRWMLIPDRTVVATDFMRKAEAEIKRLKEINAVILRDHTNLSNAIQAAGLTIEFEKGMPFITEPRKPRKVRIRQSK